MDKIKQHFARGSALRTPLAPPARDHLVLIHVQHLYMWQMYAWIRCMSFGQSTSGLSIWQTQISYGKTIENWTWPWNGHPWTENHFWNMIPTRIFETNSTESTKVWSDGSFEGIRGPKIFEILVKMLLNFVHQPYLCDNSWKVNVIC